MSKLSDSNNFRRRNNIKFNRNIPLVCYVSGALTSNDKSEQDYNIECARLLYRQILLRGHVPVCTFLTNYNFENNSDIDYQTWLNNGIRIMLKCDCMILVDNNNNEKSKGLMTELYYARLANKPVFKSISDLPYFESLEDLDLTIPDVYSNYNFNDFLKEACE